MDKELRCSICGCSENETSKFYKYGKILERTIFDRNRYEIIKNEKDEYAEIILENRKFEEVARVIIDIEDLERVLKYKWRYESEWGYVSTGNSIGKNYIMLQNFILNIKGELIDHIDRNTLNNRKNNLKLSINH